MTKIIDFMEAKADKRGTITPLAVAESLLAFIRTNPGSVDKLAVVVRLDDGVINTAYSTMNHLELVGIHETAKQMALEDMNA